MAIQENLDQTQFAENRPLYEEPAYSLLEDDESQKVDEGSNKKPIYKQKIVWLIAAIVILLLIIVIATPSRKTPEQAEEVAPEIVDEQTEISSDPLRKRVDDLRSELKDADPTKPQLIFPALNRRIELDSSKK